MAGVLRQPLLRSRAATPFFLFPSQAAVQQCASMAVRQQTQKRLAHGSSYSRGGNSAESSPSVASQQMTEERPSFLISFRIPETFVAPPLGQYISKPAVFAKMFWWGLRSRVYDYVAELSIRLQSKPSFLKGAIYKPNRKAIGPMAKNMHYQMLEATAAGDVRTLRRLLTMSHLDEITALIARRPRGQRCEWELLSYKGSPTIASSKIVMIPGAVPSYIRQVVVTIRSRQRFTWTQEEVAATGTNTTNKRARRRAAAAAAPAPVAPAPPRVVETDVRENVVLVATLNRTTWQTHDWRIFGFMNDTTPESWLREHDLVRNASKDGATNLGGVDHR